MTLKELCVFPAQQAAMLAWLPLPLLVQLHIHFHPLTAPVVKFFKLMEVRYFHLLLLIINLLLDQQ